MADLGRFLETLAFTGGGMATGNIPGAMAQMGLLRQNRQSMAFDQELQRQKMEMLQAAAARKAKQAEAMQAIAPMTAATLFPGSPNIQQFLAANTDVLGDIIKQRAGAGIPTAHARNVQAYLAASPDERAIMDRMPAFGGGQPGTVVNVGSGGPKFGPVQAGQARVEDPGSETGYRLVDVPGAKVSDTALRGRAIAGEQQELIQIFMDGLKDESGNLSTAKLAQARAPGTTLNNLLGRISQNEVYLKSGAAANIGEQLKTEASIQPSIAQIMAGSDKDILGQLERSSKFAGRFLGEEPEEEEGEEIELPGVPPGWTIKKVGE